MVKLVFSWNIIDSLDREYFEFIVQEFAPKIARMGIRLTEAWYTVYGAGPQIIMPCVTPDRIALEATMISEEWSALVTRLQGFVTDYACRVVD
jgi:hypothetical protein